MKISQSVLEQEVVLPGMGGTQGHSTLSQHSEFITIQDSMFRVNEIEKDL